MKTKEKSPANGANLREYSPAETQGRGEIPVGQASRLPLTQGRDGSPQPSQVSGADAPSWPFKLQVSGLNSPVPPLRASAPPREISPLRSQVSAFRFQASAFTLLEVLVATAVLAMMMTFLFNLLGSSTKLWEIGNKKIEAAQAARVGLNIMASDLKNAVSANNTAQTSSGNITCVIPFIALGNSTTTAMDMGGGAQNALGSQQMAGVLLTDNPEIPYNEFGYMAVFLNDPNGLEPMIGKRYYLVKQTDSTGSTGGNFYFQGSPDTDWYKNSDNYYPVIENCIRLKFDFYGNQTNSSGPPSWVPNWENSSGPIVDRLPLGVLVTISIVDSRTATKLAALSGNSALSEIDITAGLNAAAGNGAASSLTPIQSLISQGSVTLSRFIPFNTK